MASDGAVALQRPRQVALVPQHVADLVVRHRQVALPAGIAGVGLGQTLGDGERRAVALQRPRQVALGPQHVADLLVRHRQVALPAGIAGVGLGQAISHGLRLQIVGLGRRQVATLLADIAQAQSRPVDLAAIGSLRMQFNQPPVGPFRGLQRAGLPISSHPSQ